MELKAKVNRLNDLEKEFFIEIVQKIKYRNTDMLNESFKDIERFNESEIKGISNAIEKMQILKQEGYSLTVNKKSEILNEILLQSLDL
ncbi:MAG: hypothetical protein KIC66_07925 [Clostridium sp.]|uniref:hypothetical protein n=1 Tax=Clostridium TaxID=1485 RepID=UPI001C1E006C|nr:MULTISPECIES: hypothetical protein [Clostridium]MBS5926999.1 hypothetical protein [Clostridium sp.]MBU6134538.1 hypothetical protein [Clostridium tertium]